LLLELARTAPRPHAIGDLVSKPQIVFGVDHNRVFCADVHFIRTEDTVGAQSAQWSRDHGI
jgi:hypothetical protein